MERLQTVASGAEEKPVGRVLAGLLLAVSGLVILQFTPHEAMRSPYALLVFLAVVVALNAWTAPAGLLCWPNIFVVVLAVFHLGFYVPSRLNLLGDLGELEGIIPHLTDSPDLDLALWLFAVAVLAFEVGALAASLRSSKGPVQGVTPDRLFFQLGLVVTGLAFALFGVYVYQLGGLAALRATDYSTYVTFLQSSDPRFAAISITYLPAGLLLLYAFLDRTKPNSRLWASAAVGALVIFALWLLWVGNRGAALLSVTAIIYVRHVRVKRVPVRTLGILVLALLLVIGPVRQLRNLSPTERAAAVQTIDYNVLEGVAEMGLTIRPYLAFIEQHRNGQSLGLSPYGAAFGHVIPNVGLVNRRAQIASPTSFRSTVWVSYVVDPISAALGIGVGGSAIGEPYGAGGVTGVVVLFLLLGLLIGFLEWRVAARPSPYALAFICLAFYPITWYVRDDAYSVLRPVAWALFALAVVKVADLLTGERLPASAGRSAGTSLPG